MASYAVMYDVIWMGQGGKWEHWAQKLSHSHSSKLYASKFFKGYGLLAYACRMTAKARIFLDFLEKIFA